MAKQSWIIQRGAVWYYRRKVPLDLLPNYSPKTELIFSLKVKDRSAGDSLKSGIKTTIGGVTHSISFGEHGQVQTNSTSSSRVSSSDLQSHHGEILSTAISPNGLPVNGRDIQDTDLVRVGKVQISARLAYENGLISKDSNGKYTSGK